MSGAAYARMGMPAKSPDNAIKITNTLFMVHFSFQFFVAGHMVIEIKMYEPYYSCNNFVQDSGNKSTESYLRQA